MENRARGTTEAKGPYKDTMGQPNKVWHIPNQKLKKKATYDNMHELESEKSCATNCACV